MEDAARALALGAYGFDGRLEGPVGVGTAAGVIGAAGEAGVAGDSGVVVLTGAFTGVPIGGG